MLRLTCGGSVGDFFLLVTDVLLMYPVLLFCLVRPVRKYMRIEMEKNIKPLISSLHTEIGDRTIWSTHCRPRGFFSLGKIYAFFAIMIMNV